MSMFTWLKLIRGLRKRGGNRRESGAFLLGRKDNDKVTKVIYYDELEPDVSSSGIIVFSQVGHIELFSLLKELDLEVKADIHTHPGQNTQQSASDQRHPMIRLKGHIAMIAPNFAQKKFLLPRECSAYLYQGSFSWKQLMNEAFPIRLTLL